MINLRRVAVMALLLVAPALSTACKSTGAASLKDADDLSDGMTSHKPDLAKRTHMAGRMGMELGNGAGGARVENVEPATFARSIGFVAGDVIKAVNGKSVVDAKAFETVAQAFIGNSKDAAKWSGVWIFKVQRGGKEVSLKPVSGYDCDPYLLIGCGPLNGPAS